MKTPAAVPAKIASLPGALPAAGASPRGVSSPGLVSRALSGLLLGYKRWVSPWLPRSCRFTPTCSEYARLAVLRHGAARGTLKSLARLARCQPLFPGGVDLP